MARIDAARSRARRAEIAPPPEQMKRVPFIETDINEHSLGYDEDGKPFVTKVRIGRAFQRQARFETIDGLTPPQIHALRRYRRAFDVSEVSPVKSALDIGQGGDGGGVEGVLTRLEVLASAGQALRQIEGLVSPDLLGVLRAVALDDLDFKTIAEARWGNATGRRRELVKDHFMLAVDQLTYAVARRVATARQEAMDDLMILEVGGQPVRHVTVDPAFLDEKGHMRPYADIAAILRGADLEDATATE
ncbi:hypothetical protein [Sphingomonas abaci]|uniref:Uncharacterized protein n=1 Tax=Sphingomonas abaci TaxID=237611 RepID=A0A7W7AMQ1_9SPHN|nr:hypothetical protein [Sphingomonas abaci]MBB4618974.1 hypothetical protein [Sphingomonas abaci]